MVSFVVHDIAKVQYVLTFHDVAGNIAVSDSGQTVQYLIFATLNNQIMRLHGPLDVWNLYEGQRNI